MNYQRWLDLMNSWNFPANQETFDALVSAYSEKHRHYHNRQHIEACLKHIDRCASHMDNPRQVELALWFHDAVYNPLSANNELKSAEWAVSFLSSNGVSLEKSSDVYSLIMATVHNSPPATKDQSLLIDIDLSILGSDEKIYDVFEYAVRQEYKMVPSFLYKRKRAAVLKGFLDRCAIYNNEPFKSEWEARARHNLSRAISRLIGK